MNALNIPGVWSADLYITLLEVDFANPHLRQW
jgi:hypothetical protein